MAPSTKEKRETSAGCVSQGRGKRSWKRKTSERVAANMTMKVKSMVRSAARSEEDLEEGEVDGPGCVVAFDGDDVAVVVADVILPDDVDAANLSDGAGMRSRMERIITISIVCILFSFATSWNRSCISH